MSADDILARRAFGGVFDHAAPEVQEGMRRFVRAARLPRARLVELVAGVAFGPGVAEDVLGRLEHGHLERSRCTVCGRPAAYFNVYSNMPFCRACADTRPDLVQAGVLTPLKRCSQDRPGE